MNDYFEVFLICVFNILPFLVKSSILTTISVPLLSPIDLHVKVSYILHPHSLTNSNRQCCTFCFSTIKYVFIKIVLFYMKFFTKNLRGEKKGFFFFTFIFLLFTFIQMSFISVALDF